VMLLLGSFLKIAKVAHIFGPLFPKLYAIILTKKLGWATFWAIFSEFWRLEWTRGWQDVKRFDIFRTEQQYVEWGKIY
jgi:hypothetical protein